MKQRKAGYEKDLREQNFDKDNKLGELLEQLKESLGLEKELPKVPSELIRGGDGKKPITKLLTRLELRIAPDPSGNGWAGLLVGFPGSVEQLTTEHMSTPFLRKILYPILDLFGRLAEKEPSTRCLYILGARFSDVFLRKVRLLKAIVPHLILVTDDLLQCKRNAASAEILVEAAKMKEKRIQAYLWKKMREPDGLCIPTEGGDIRVKHIAYEVPTYEGTEEHERLDLLGYDSDKKGHSLVAIEIKRPFCERVELENLFFQGVEHRNWLEENKMAVKLMFKDPNGKNINTKKRVRLILGFNEKEMPDLFHDLRERAKRDPYLNIDFCKINPVNGGYTLSLFS